MKYQLSEPCIIAPNKPELSGYHQVMVNRRRWKAHVYAYNMTYGPPPLETPFILHKCNNKSCWNPSHLYAGTNSQNQLDAVAAGTHPEARRTHCPKGHPYAGDNLIIQKDRHRKCHTCQITNRRARRPIIAERINAQSRAYRKKNRIKVNAATKIRSAKHYEANKTAIAMRRKLKQLMIKDGAL